MKRLFSLFALVLVASLASGCGSSTSPASVNGESIDGGEFLDRLGQYAEFNSGSDHSASMEDSSALLTEHILAALRSDEVKRLGLNVSADDIAATRAQVVAALDEAIQGGNEDAKVFKASYIDFVARIETEHAALSARITDTQNPWFTADDVRSYYDAVKDTKYRKYCTHHILVAAESDARTIIGQLENGADFGQIAKERSTDAGSAVQGGDLGCVTKGEFVPEFEDAVLNASAGDTIGPIQTSAGYHVIRIDREYSVLDLDNELRSEIAADLSTEAGWMTWKIHRSKIQVNRRYGTWSNDLESVVSPTDPTVK